MIAVFFAVFKLILMVIGGFAVGAIVGVPANWVLKYMEHRECERFRAANQSALPQSTTTCGG